MFRRKQKPTDFSAEIEAHLKLEADRLRELGLSEEDAQAAARRSFGNVTAAKERFYETGRQLWWDHLQGDLRYSFRMMRMSPTLTAVIVLTLALGIGANSVIFSFVRAVVLRPLAYNESSRLVQVWESGFRSGGEADWVSFPNFRDWRRQNRVFTEMAAYRFALMTLTGQRQAESVLGIEATNRLFEVLGVQPLVGRTFLPTDGLPGQGNVAVISYALWQRSFGGGPAIYDKPVNIDGKPYSVVGVMPPSFRFPSTVPGETIVVPIDLWVPVRPSEDLEQRGSHNFWAIARLRSGIGLAEARADMQTIGVNLAREHTGTNAGMGVSIARLQDHMTTTVRPAMLLLLASVGMVLLLACANIANLLLSRAEARKGEMAIRIALGARRSRLISQALTESLLLSLLGAAAGLGIAHFGTALARKLGPANIPRFQEAAIDAQVLLFTLIVSVAGGILFGLVPALLSAQGVNVHYSLKEAGTRSTADLRNLTVRSVLVGSEMALAVLLLISAGLLLRSFVNLVGLDPGFHAPRVLSAFINLAESRYPDPPNQAEFFEEALRRIRALPGVQSAAASNSIPLSGINDQGGFRIEGRPEPAPGDDGPWANRPRVSSGYFETMGIRLLQGRAFDHHDVSTSPYVAIVSDLATATFWPHESPIGKRISVNWTDGKPVWREIVGVVRGTKHFGLEAPQKPEVYLPHTQLPTPFMTILVSARMDPSSLIASIRREIAAIDPEQAGFGFQSMDDLVSISESRRRFQAILLTAFASLAMILAAIGIYGVIEYTATQRGREIGVRLALGALPRDVVWMMVRKGLLLTAAGIIVGIGGAIALSRILGAFLFGVRPIDLPTFGTVALILIMVGALSTYLPSRRAAKVDPIVALREE